MILSFSLDSYVFIIFLWIGNDPARNKMSLYWEGTRFGCHSRRSSISLEQNCYLKCTSYDSVCSVWGAEKKWRLSHCMTGKAKIEFVGLSEDKCAWYIIERWYLFYHFILYFLFVASTLASKDCVFGGCLRFRTIDTVSSLTQLKAKSKTFSQVIWEFLYPDYIDLVSHTENTCKT